MYVEQDSKNLGEKALSREIGAGGRLRLAVISLARDNREGEVLVCHAPEGEKNAVSTRGIISWHSLGLSAVGEEMGGTSSPGEGALLVCREGSVGWLLRCYACHTSALIYAELPCPSSRVWPMMSTGVLGGTWRFFPTGFSVAERDEGEAHTPSGANDEQIYRSLQETWLSIQPMTQGYLDTDSHKRVSSAALEDMMDDLARLTGCTITCRHCDGGRLACFVPRLAEIYALICLCIAQHDSPERHLWYTVEKVADVTGPDDRLAFHIGFTCPVEAGDDSRPVEAVMRCLTFLRDVAEGNDSMLLWSLGEPWAMETYDGIPYRPLTVSLLFLSDPVRELWSDFKHPELWPLDAEESRAFGI